MNTTPAEVILTKDVAWDLRQPCGDCPFLKTSPFHEGVAESLPVYGESIVNGTFSHSCHKTDNRPACDGPRNHEGPTQHCVGSVLMLLKTGRGMDLQLPLLEAGEAGKFDLAAMTARAKSDARVFTFLEMLTFYTNEGVKRLRSAAGRLLKRKRKAARQSKRKGRNP